MKFNLMLIFALMAGAICNTISAQTKVGYTNVELIMAYMPEVKRVHKDMERFQQQLEQKIDSNRSIYQAKVNDYYEKAESGQYPTDAAKAAAENEIAKLENETQQLIANAETQLMVKQQELMRPVMEKIQSKIDEVAREGNFTYILNQTSGTNILYGLKTMDVTPQIAAKLGLNLPE